MKALLVAVVLCFIAGASYAKLSKPKGEIECFVCEELVKVLKQYAEENATEAEVKEAIEKFCDDLPSPINGVCNDIVDNYFDEIWNAVINDLTPAEVCQQVGLCGSKKVPTEKAPVKTSTKPAKVGGQVECFVCEELVKVLEQYAEENQTEAQVKAAIEQFCASLPDPLDGVCKNIVDNFFDEIWNDILNELTPAQICEQIGLCGTAKLPVKKAPLKQTPVCDECKTITAFLQIYVDENATEAEAEEALEQLCKLLNSPTCDSYITTYFPVVWQLLKSEIDGGYICIQLGLCPSKQLTSSLKVKADVCDYCHIVSSFLKVFVDANSSQAEIESALEGLCKILPASAQCDALVTEYWPLIFTLLKSEIDSGEICVLLKLCPEHQVTAPPVNQPQQSVECQICEIVVKFLQPFIDENSTEDEVKAGLEALCNALPSSVSSTCTELVNEYFDIIWALLKAEVDSDQICEIIGLCTNSTILYRHQPVQLSKPQDTVECEACHIAVAFMKPWVDRNATEDEVKEALEEFCKLLPSQYSAECSSIVADNFGVVWALMKAEVDNGQICVLIGACTSTAKRLTKPLAAKVLLAKQKVQSNQTCNLCKALVAFVKPYVDNNTDEAIVKADLEQFCKLLPSTVSDECLEGVDTYLPIIWALLKEQVDAGAICIELGLCTTQSHHQPVTGTGLKPSVDSGPLCVICEFVLKEIEARLPINATEDEIVNLVMNICDVLPSSVETECKDFIKEYGPEIIKQLINNIAPNAVCVAIHLCVVSASDSAPVISHSGNCSWGPSYWCSSLQAMSECNAAAYCKSAKML